MNPIKLKIRRLSHSEGLQLPLYATDGAAGMDVLAALQEDLELLPGQRIAVPTGLSVEVPSGYELQVRARSGRAFREGLTVLNGPGTIDSDFRGEVKILLVNLGTEPVRISRGERIAQWILAPVFQAEWELVDGLTETNRAAGGFGSTGR